MEEAEYCQRLGLIYRGELIALGTPDDLKARFMTATVLEVVAAPAYEAMEVIATVKGVREAALFGTTVHAVLPHDSEATIDTIEAALVAAGFAKGEKAGDQQRTLASIRAIKPSLEDVFVSLVEERDAREAPLREVRA
jgi:ABC-2 type transport system ATP-binding protein